MDSTSQSNELVGVIIQMLIILQMRFPLPACIHADMIGERIFLSHGSSSSLITNGIIYYLLSIADPFASRNIQWPIGTQNQATFNQTIFKALKQILRDHEAFQLSCRSSLASILKDRKGPKFNKFLFELARNALRITNLNHGSRAVPQLSSDIPVDDRRELMKHNVDRLNTSLTHKRNAVSRTEDLQLLGQLEQKRIGLKKRSDELIQICPSKYREQMNANGPVQQNLLVTNQWRADLNGITNEQTLKNNLITAHNNCVEAVRAITRDKLAGEDLVNDQNEPILVKTANENNIELLQGDSVSLSGFMESSCVISGKLKMLVVNKDMQHLAEDFSVPLERSSCTLSKMNKEISDGEQLVESLIEKCKESRKMYEEGVNAQGGHQFPLPDLELEIRVDTPPAPYSPSHLIHSPGTESPKRILEEAKRRHRDAGDCAAASDDSMNTPMSRGALNRSRNQANSSMSQLTKSVLQKQTLSATLASHANSTVGDMVPLSSSSPVSVRGTVQKPPAGPADGTRSARSSLADVLNELDESNLSFWDLSEESYVMNSTFGSPGPPMTQAAQIDVNEAFDGPFVGVGSRLPVPLTLRNGGNPDKKPSLAPAKMAPSAARCGPSGTQPTVAPCDLEPNGQSNDLTVPVKRPSTAPAASPARRPRRSIQNIIERFQRFKANHANAEVKELE